MSIRMTKKEMGMLYELNNYDKKLSYWQKYANELAIRNIIQERKEMANHGRKSRTCLANSCSLANMAFHDKKKIKSSCHAKGKKKIFP